MQKSSARHNSTYKTLGFEIDQATARKIASIFKIGASIKANKNLLSVSGKPIATVTNVEKNKEIDFSGKAIANQFTIKDEDGSATMHVFNFQDGGFVAVAANTLEQSIVAFDAQSSFYENISKSHPINEWIAREKIRMSALRKGLLKEKDSSAILKGWSKYSLMIGSNGQLATNTVTPNVICPQGYVYYCPGGPAPNVSSSSTPSGTPVQRCSCIPVNPPPPEPCTTNWQIGPMLSTIWNQYAGDGPVIFNGYCPINSAGPDGRDPVGCTAVAIGQILAYWKPTTLMYNYQPLPIQGTTIPHSINTFYIDYSPASIPQDTSITAKQHLGVSSDMIAQLLRDIGATVNMSYDPSGSGAFPDYENIFKMDYGFSSDVRYTNYLSTDVFGEMQAGRPVILEGWPASSQNPGHAWNCDGFYAEPKVCYLSGWSDYTMWIHQNWGFGGANDGWFSPNAFDMDSNPADQFNHNMNEVERLHL